METLGAAKVAARIKGEGANEPEQLNQIFEFEEAAQIEYEPEQLNEIFEFRGSCADRFWFGTAERDICG